MSKIKVLIATQDMQPYTELSEMAAITRRLAQYVQEHDMEVRVLMPKFGTINERRHRLHEVVRLSGMNIIVDDDDYPLIIKVASLPEARMQIYFLDNDDFFKRKSVFVDEAGEPFDDNVDRMVFFCKGVIETVKKFGWAPDIVHCHGWMTSLIPLYLKTAYRADPLFQNARVVYSVYADPLEKAVNDKFLAKAAINNVTSDDLHAYQNGTGITLHKGAVIFADALVKGSETLSEATEQLLNTADKPLLMHPGDEDFAAAYTEFYQSLVEEKVSK